MKNKLQKQLAAPDRFPGIAILKTARKALFLFFAIVFIVNTRAAAAYPPCTPPTITSTTGATVCGFGTIVLTATASSGTIDWYSSGGAYLGSGTSYTTFIAASATYYVDATDAGCTTPSRTAITATANPKPTATATASKTSACEGDVVTFTAGATGATAPYTYSWSGPDGFSSGSTTSTTVTTDALTIYDAGFYNLLVTDNNGCTGTSGVGVSVYTNPVLSTVATPNPVCTGNTLYLTTGVNHGGSDPFTYSWTGPSGYTGTGETPVRGDAVSTHAGVYSVTVTDGRGCTGSGTTAAVSVITNTVSITTTSDLSICPGTSTPLSTTGASTYDWNPGTGLNTAAGANVTASPSSTTTYVVTGHVGNCYSKDTVTVVVLTTYSVTASVTTTNGTISEAGTTSVCSGTDKTYTITPNSGYHIADVQVDGVSIGNTPPFVIHNVLAPHTITATFAPDCTTPSISATTGGSVCGSGTVNLGATASAGTINWYAASTGGSSIGTGTTYSPSVTGTTTYYVDATDGACVSSRTAVTATVNSNPSASASVTNVLCNGAATGAVTVSGSGGSGSYTVTGDAVTGLSAGSYNYTVTDGNGCTATVSATVTQPSSALTASSSVTNVLCNGGSTGAVVVSAAGGTGTISGTGTFSGLNAGSYSYTVTDANGCTAATSGSITEPSALTASSSVTNVLCNGGSTGAVVVSAAGGTGTISGTGTFSGLNAGSYSYTVTDANGCTAATSGSITEPSALTASSSVTNVLCNGGSTGAVVVSAAGGTGTISGTGTFSGLNAGSYSYTVTDANGCTAATSGSITEPSALTASSSVTNVLCNGGSTGAVVVSATGGAGTISGTGTFSGLNAGSYSYTVTDANGCTAATSGSITQPSAISVTATATNVSCHSTNGGNHSNGSIATSVSGGTGSYSYSWSNSSNGTNATGLSTGTYTVTVTDANSCTKKATATVGQPSALGVTVTPVNVSCGGSSNGSCTASVSGGTSGYTYAWSNSHTGATTTGLAAGTYSVTVTDANSCTTTGSASVGTSTTTTCTITGNSSVLGGVPNTFTGTSGMSSYTWSVASCGTSSITGSTTGSSVSVTGPCSASTYTLTLTAINSSGCTSTVSKTVTVNPSAKISVYSTLYTTGSGWHPSTTKSVLASDIKVFTRSTSRRRNGSQTNYSSIWNSTTGQVTNVVVSSPTTVNIGGGPAYKYTLIVPAGGRYLVVGKSVVSSTRCGGSTCTIYTGKKLGGNDDCDGDEHGRDDDDDDDLDACSSSKVRFQAVIKDQSGRCREADTHEEHGSLMLVVSPMELDFEDSVSYLPVIYESVEGDWSVSVTAEPPYGFYTEPSGELSTSITDSVMNAVQFNVIDTGSEWTFTTLTHSIAHKGENRTALSKPAMVNERTNKPVEVNLTPNPATDVVRIAMPKFEGRATIFIYDLMGQVVAQKPVELISGATTSMDVSKLAPGVYMVSAENTSGKASARLIINAE